MTRIFVYGTLKKGLHNHDVLGKAIYLDEALTNSREFSMYDGGFPFVSDQLIDEEYNGSILGEVYQVDDENILSNLDRLEGVPTLYVKKEVDVTTLSQVPYKALMYVASKGSQNRLNQKTPMKPAGKSKILEWR